MYEIGNVGTNTHTQTATRNCKDALSYKLIVLILNHILASESHTSSRAYFMHTHIRHTILAFIGIWNVCSI